MRLRLLLSLGVTLLVVWPLLSIGPVAEAVDERLETIADVRDDVSFQARLEFYEEIIPRALGNPVGEGLALQACPPS